MIISGSDKINQGPGLWVLQLGVLSNPVAVLTQAHGPAVQHAYQGAVLSSSPSECLIQGRFLTLTRTSYPQLPWGGLHLILSGHAANGLQATAEGPRHRSTSLPRPKGFSSSMVKFQSFVLDFTKARAVHCSRAAPCLAAYHTMSFMVIISLPVRPRIKKPRSSDFFQTMKSGSCRIRTTSHCSTVGLRDQGTTMRLVRSCTTEPGNIGGRSPPASALDLVPPVFIGHR